MGRRSSQSTRDDRGETLVELMVALAIMGTAVIALVGGIGTFVQTSEIHRKQAKSQAYLREFAETLQASMATYPTGYVACSTANPGGDPSPTYQTRYSVPAADQGDHRGPHDGEGDHQFDQGLPAIVPRGLCRPPAHVRRRPG